MATPASYSSASRHAHAAAASIRPVRKPSRKRQVTIAVGVIVVLGLLALIIVRHLHKPDLNDEKTVTTRVSKHYLLPSNETPALATVTDSTKVQSAFAGKVKNNDKILIYQTNHKAIVYRPSIDRVVDVEPVSIDTPPSALKSTQ